MLYRVGTFVNTVAILASVIVAFPACAQERLLPPANVVAARLAREAANEELSRRVFTKAVSATVTDMPLRTAVEQWLKAADIPFAWDWEALSQDDVSKPMTQRLGTVSLYQALYFTLPSAGATWIIDDEMLKLTTRSVADESLLFRTYSLAREGSPGVRAFRLESLFGPWRPDRDIIEGMHPQSNASGTFGGRNLSSDANGGFVDGRRQQNTSLPPSETNLLAPPAPTNWEEVFQHLAYSVSSGPWEVYDNVGGYSTLFNKQLAVRQTPKVLWEIEGLLETLEEFPNHPDRRVGVTLRTRPMYPIAQEDAWRQTFAARASVNFRAVPMRDVLFAIGEKYQLPVCMDTVALAESHLDSAIPVDCVATDQPLGEVLQGVLKPLGFDAVLEEGGLVLTSPSQADEFLTTKLYDVCDLTMARQPQVLVDSLIERTSGQWQVVDNVGGTVLLATPRILIIMQTAAVHAEIATNLEKLRRSQPEPPPATDLPVNDLSQPLEIRSYAVFNVDLIDELLAAIPQFVAEKTWTAQPDGPKVVKLGNQLLIRQTDAVHTQIARFLQTADPSSAKSPK